MTTRELLKRYDESFRELMDDTKPWRLRLTASIRAMTLAEVMKDHERMMNAAAAADNLFSLPENDKIMTTPAVEAVKPLKPELGSDCEGLLSWVQGICCKGRHDHWKAELLEKIMSEREALTVQRAELLAAAQTLIAGCEAHLEAQGYALQISGMIATRAAIDRAEKGAS